MEINPSPTELTTSLTDAALAIECLLIVAILWHRRRRDPWRIHLWCGVFGLIALSSLLGTVVHGLEMPEPLREVLWKPLYLTLGLLTALFGVGAVYDGWGRAAATRLLPWGLGAGAAFFLLTEFTHGSFLVFVAYEAVLMLGALLIYWFMAATHRLKGAALISLAIAINLAAAGAQASPVSIHIVVPFDHNGVFHLIQMLGLALLGAGIMNKPLPPAPA